MAVTEVSVTRRLMDQHLEQCLVHGTHLLINSFDGEWMNGLGGVLGSRVMCVMSPEILIQECMKREWVWEGRTGDSLGPDWREGRAQAAGSENSRVENQQTDLMLIMCRE